MTDTELPLAGGRTTTGVVRIGDTVRRPSPRRGDFVRALLAHLASVGFLGAPRHLGRDGAGRDILSYVEGEVPEELGWHADATLVAAARLIRAYHDATVSLTPAGLSTIEVVCHNDLSPCNFVFREGLPVTLIDFDDAAPGLRRMDLAYAAWMWLDLGNDEIGAQEQRRRLALFVEAYGSDVVAMPIKDAILLRQEMLAAKAAGHVNAMTLWVRHCRQWVIESL